MSTFGTSEMGHVGFRHPTGLFGSIWFHNANQPAFVRVTGMDTPPSPLQLESVGTQSVWGSFRRSGEADLVYVTNSFISVAGANRLLFYRRSRDGLRSVQNRVVIDTWAAASPSSGYGRVGAAVDVAGRLLVFYQVGGTTNQPVMLTVGKMAAGGGDYGEWTAPVEVIPAAHCYQNYQFSPYVHASGKVDVLTQYRVDSTMRVWRAETIPSDGVATFTRMGSLGGAAGSSWCHTVHPKTGILILTVRAVGGVFPSNTYHHRVRCAAPDGSGYWGALSAGQNILTISSTEHDQNSEKRLFVRSDGAVQFSVLTGSLPTSFTSRGLKADGTGPWAFGEGF